MGRGNDARIPYALAVPDDAPNREAILKAASEYETIVAADHKPGLNTINQKMAITPPKAGQPSANHQR